MLRTTVSRVKKVCSGGLVPRILRGDHCGGPVSNAVVRKAFESKASDDGKQGTLALEDNVEKKSDEAAKLGDKTTNQCKTIVPSSIPLTQREKCQKIIDKAFGPCVHTEENPDSTAQYFSHTVNLEDTRREIIESEKAKLKLQEKVKDPLLPESRTPYSILKMSRELMQEDRFAENTLKDSVLKVHPVAEGPQFVAKDVVKTLNVNLTTAEDPDLTKNFENIGTTEETTPLIEPYLTNAKEDLEKFVTNPERIENKALRDDDAETIEIVKDDRKNNLYQETSQEQIHTLLPYHRTQIGVYTLCRDNDSDDIVLMNSTSPMPSDVEDPQPADKKNLLTKAKEGKEDVNDLKSVDSKALRVENSASAKIVKDELKHMFVSATTAKEDEEQLAQKLEIIEETPTVEAQTPKLEGFNVTPRVLGHQTELNSKTTEKNPDNSPKADLTRNLDDVAKRCLNSPLGQIDEILLNEIEKHPIASKTESKTPSKPLLRSVLLQMDEINKEPNIIPEEKNHFDCSKFKEEEKLDSDETYTGLISPIPHITLESRLPDFNEDTEENAVIKPKEDSKLPGEILQAVKQKTERKPIVRNTKTNKAIVTEIHIVGIDRKQDSERNTSLVTTKASVSDELKRKDVSKDVQSKVETENTYSKMTSFDLNDAANNINRNERLLKPELMSNFKGAHRPTYYGTTNASKFAMNEPQSIDTDKKNTSPRSLSDAYMWDHNEEDASASEIKCLRQEETDEIERYGLAPQGQSTGEKMVEHEQTTANKELERTPYNTVRVPTQTWDKTVEHAPKVNKINPISPHDKPSSTKEPQLKPDQEYVKVSITDELFREHALDPYYVLACNETCPIAPVSNNAPYIDSDFVDTTQTIYMKKNICESLRPKPKSKDVTMACEKIPAETQALHELDVKLEPEIIPEIGYTAMPEVKPTAKTEESLPKLNEQLSLSELLKRVRQRNRLECMNDLKSLGVSVDPTVGKCNRKAPRCPPTAPRSPPNNPVPPPSFGLPMLKRRPPVCKGPKKKPGCKCISCDMDTSCGVRIGKSYPEMDYELNVAEICALKSKADVTEEVLERLHHLSKVMRKILRKVRSNAETLFAREYDPWTPIPSWPTPKKEEQKKWEPGKQCNYKCPVYPKARASMNPEPPCDLKPCRGFPKRRSFSMLDCFTGSL